MGLFDTLVSGLAASDAQHAALYTEVGKLVDEQGGVAGLQQKFQQAGLGGVIAGWISTGPNPPVTPAQTTQVVGDDKIAEVAAKTGIPQDQVAAAISKLLPLVVDHLTPNGTVPDHNSALLDMAMGVLKSRLLAS
jgi:uncharacterized protein YidB (DUF937 family)